MNHYIGGNSSFDADMETVNIFVRAKNLGDYQSQSDLFNYYKSRLLSYWDFFENSINQPNYQEYFQHTPSTFVDYGFKSGYLRRISDPSQVVTFKDVESYQYRNKFGYITRPFKENTPFE